VKFLRSTHHRFSRADERVYNPFSVANYIEERKLANYWFESGTSSLLAKVLHDDPSLLTQLESTEIVHANPFEAAEIDVLDPIQLLYQTGYLTISTYNHSELPYQQSYTLCYPNEETRRSFSLLILSSLTSLQKEGLRKVLLSLRMALHQQALDRFVHDLQGLLATIPYHLHVEKEAYYHSLLQLLFYLMDLEVHSEVATSTGRTDMVVKTNTHIYIFEFKFVQGAERALKQIEKKRYYEAYLLEGLPITLVGLSFSYHEKILSLEYQTRTLGDLVRVPRVEQDQVE